MCQVVTAAVFVHAPADELLAQYAGAVAPAGRFCIAAFCFSSSSFMPRTVSSNGFRQHVCLLPHAAARLHYATHAMQLCWAVTHTGFCSLTPVTQKTQIIHKACAFSSRKSCLQ